MQSLAGDGYTLHTHRGQFSGTMRDGLLLILEGRFMVASHETMKTHHYHTGEGAEFIGALAVTGYGRIAFVQHRERIDKPAVLKRRKPVLTGKNWGYELEVPNDEHLMQLKLLHVVPGHRTSEQYHVHKDEVQIFFEEESTRNAHYAPGEIHRVTGPAHYVEASTYAPDDVVRVSDDYGRV